MADVASVSVVDEHDDNDCGNLEPFFFDEAATQAAAAAKWRKWEDEEKAQEEELLTRGGKPTTPSSIGSVSTILSWEALFTPDSTWGTSPHSTSTRSVSSLSLSPLNPLPWLAS